MRPSRAARGVALAAALLSTLAAREAGAANDPRLKWRTLETPHFRVNFYSGEEEIARRVADLAESINAKLSPALGWTTSERTELTITDQTEYANAFATAIPYNAITMFSVAPDDLSPLGDVDDWYGTLITHEYTHVLHTDHIRGVPALFNVLMGKFWAPNQIVPRWMLEGLAVYEETEKTAGGRLRSPTWNMFMRMDALEHNLAKLDEFSNTPRRWPQGNLWYLYGSFFMQWIAETYGQEAIRAMIEDQAWQIVPFGVNRSLRRVTGRTFEDLYPSWVDTLEREAKVVADRVKARGLREGRRLTFHGQSAANPRFVPKNALGPHEDAILYRRDDGHDALGLVMLPIARDAKTGAVSAKDTGEMVVRVSGAGYPTFMPDGSLVFDSADVFRNTFSWNDLFSMAPGERGPSGMEDNRKRLSWGWRATEPSASPDGRQLVFTTTTRGTSYLQIADVRDGAIVNVRSLVRSAPLEQAYSPRFSPDGKWVAYSSWSRGGYRDVRLVDARTGEVHEITHDRAIDGGPSFSPDGRWIFFHSDRVGGIVNVFAWEIGTSNMKQVTNVLGGAFQPEVSPDGKTLAYTGYHARGYDIYAMPLDPSQWLDVPAYVDDRPAAQPEPAHHDWPIHDYNPLYTLRPHSYSINVGPGNFGGQALVLGLSGADAAGHHAFGLSLIDEFEHPDLQVDASYTYARLPFNVGLRGYRGVAPRTAFQQGASFKPQYAEETLGVESSISYGVPRAFDGHSLSATYSFARVDFQVPFSAAKVDPYETPVFPSPRSSGGLRLAWSYSNAQSFLWSVGGERGFAASTSVELTDPALGSTAYSGYRAIANLTTYVQMPWGKLSRHLAHHSLALHAGGGASGGVFPGSGNFYIGGFADVNWLDTIRNLSTQGSIVLRGYAPLAQTGHYYGLFNAEYRFPIVNIDRGPSTVPLFLNRLSGSVFVDVGSVFEEPRTAKLRTGVGGELWLDTTWGYVRGFQLRLGYAHGLATGGIDKLYFVLSSPY